ncbi:unnamed protein product [Adineta steineri]|uniref:Uncharacterized protein n=1 Tax=Adineta steineri TaxID=433720 RepID=A0A814SJD7_9BILA|nr:unnamed protein product [Adineta steineri]CAF1149116.1 unnamed protein product [Adineta steineri]
MKLTKRFRGDLDGIINIQQKLFPITAFNDRKLFGDIRIRLEQRLRDAGLIQTDYARQAMAALQQAPNHPIFDGMDN